MQVAYPTTPANYFHVLRRQMHRQFRKPLIVMTPKSLLRHKRCVSFLSDMEPGTSFHRVFRDQAEVVPGATTVKLVPDAEIKRVVLCTGKVYFDLMEEREKRGENRIQILRIEQLYPFPERPAGAGAGPLPQGRDRLVPGRAQESGRLDLRASRASKTLIAQLGGTPKAALCRAARIRLHRGGPDESAHCRTSCLPQRGFDAITAQFARRILMSIEIKVPAMGESVTEATVARWFKKEGDAVTRDEPLLELETDKVTVEVPAPADGAIERISVKAGATVQVGTRAGRDRRRQSWQATP